MVLSYIVYVTNLYNYCRFGYAWFMVFNVTFNNISVIVAVISIGEGNRSIRGKPPTFHMSLTNVITSCCIEDT
jgi:hypothetical protein